MKFAVRFSFLAFLLVFFHETAFGCSCMPPKGPVEEMQRADAVFSGQVIRIVKNDRRTDPFEALEVTIAVEKQWKGNNRSEQSVFTASNSAACGFNFDRGTSYLVYAYADKDGKLTTGICSRTAKLSNARDDVRELDRDSSKPQQQSDAMPKWLSDHFAFMCEGSGRWITDNAKFKSSDEPYDEYGTEWKWGIGKKSIKGRLFALNARKEVGEFWEYRAFWHPKEKRAIFEQFGSGGVYGVGEMRALESPEGTAEINVEMIFYSPDGTSWHDLHKLSEAPNVHTTRSFNLKDGQWQPRRTYIWRRS